MRTWILTSLTIALTSVGARAQFPLVFLPHTSRVPLPSATPQDGATVTGNFDGNFIADAASIVGGSLRFTHDLQFDRTLVTLPIQASDVTRRRVSSTRDQFVSVGASGLVVSSWDNNLTLVGDNMAGLVSSTLSTAAGWVGASQVRCADVDGDGDEDIVALTNGGTTIESMLASTTGFATGPTRTLASPAQRIAFVRYPGTDKYLVACVGAGTTIAVNVATGATFSLALPSGDYRALVGMEFGGTSWLAGIANPLVPGQYDTGTLHYANWAGATGSIPLAWLDAVSLTAGDMNGDTLPDLCVNSRVAGEIVLVGNRYPATPVFSITDPFALWLTAPTVLAGTPPQWIPSPLAPDASRTATLALCDVDQDGDQDITFTDRPEQKLLVLRNPVVGHPTATDPFPGGPLFPGYEVDGFEYFDGPELPLGVVTDLHFESPGPTAFTSLELVMWQWSNGVMNPDPAFYSIVTHGQPLSDPIHVSVPVLIPETQAQMPFELYSIRVRFVDIDPVTGAITAAGPASYVDCDFRDVVITTSTVGTNSTPISGGGVTPRPGGSGGSSGGSTTP